MEKILCKYFEVVTYKRILLQFQPSTGKYGFDKLQ